jgi:hypothetical protein
MSKGTQQYAFRLPKNLIEDIDDFCARSVNFRRDSEPDNRTTFVRKAIEERLAKLQRGRKRKPVDVVSTNRYEPVEPSPLLNDPSVRTELLKEV